MTHDHAPFLIPDTETDDEPHASSPTAHVLDEMALYGYRPGRDEPDPRPLPENETVRAELGAIVDGFAAMLTDTRLEDDLDDLVWSFVNLFHRKIARVAQQLDANEQAQRRSQLEQNGSEVRSVELERLTAQGIGLIERNGKEFQAALAEKGWGLARGDRRGFVAIDSNGAVHSVARHIEGAKVADVRQRFADIDPRDLKSVAEAKQVQRERRSERIQGASIERDGKDRPGRSPSHPAESLEAERTGVSPHRAKALMTGIWRTTTNGKEFQAALEDKGWILARGERRDFVALDPAGGVHSVARRIEGTKLADVRQRFADLDPRQLRSAAEARHVQRERQRGHERGHGRPRAANPREAGHRLQPAAAGPRQRTPAFGRIGRPRRQDRGQRVQGPHGRVDDTAKGTRSVAADA